MSCRNLFVALGVLATSMALLAAEREDSPTQSTIEVSALMRAKLASSQKVVEGLVAKDFDLIRKGGDEMSRICLATQWQGEDDQMYAHYRSELRRTGLKLVLLAEEKNLDGAAYTYLHSLTTCISCHDHCRDVLHVATKSPKLEPIPSNENGNATSPSNDIRR